MRTRAGGGAREASSVCYALKTSGNGTRLHASPRALAVGNHREEPDRGLGKSRRRRAGGRPSAFTAGP